MRRRKSDYGTIILHWLFVAATSVAFLTGLRIAAEAPGRTWINLFDMILPHNVWVPHMQAAVLIVALSLAYVIYLTRSGLSRRVALDRSRLHGFFGPKQSRLGALNILLLWGFFATMLALIASGALLYFGVYAGHNVVLVHWYGTWFVLGFVCLHILTHSRIGGASQLLRVFRPQRLPTPAPKLDAIELLTLLVETSERSLSKADHTDTPTPRAPSQPKRNPAPVARHQDMPPRLGAQQATDLVATGSVRRVRGPIMQSNPFVVAAAVAITFASVVVASDWVATDTLRISRIGRSDRPTLDGDTSDSIWRNAHPLAVMTHSGDHFDGKGDTRVEVRAVHDGSWAYFLFTWEDPTRSLKQLPLIKKSNGWRLLQNGHEAGDEHEFNEDKFSVLFTTLDTTLAGDRTFHAGPRPIPDAPPTGSGRGLHFTSADGVYADVWQWKATSGGPSGWMDDAHFGPPLAPTPMQVANRAPYRGGFAPDPGEANYAENFVADAHSAGGPVTPRRLPRDLSATKTAMGTISLDPSLGESDGASWFMTESDSVPYSSESDRAIPVGTVIPGVILSGQFSGDRADIRCAARWAAGHWALEVARRLDTQSQYDIPLRSGVFMRVAAFDHSQIRHTRHVRPIRLEVE